jgi:hypothetical protein
MLYITIYIHYIIIYWYIYIYCTYCVCVRHAAFWTGINANDIPKPTRQKPQEGSSVTLQEVLDQVRNGKRVDLGNIFSGRFAGSCNIQHGDWGRHLRTEQKLACKCLQDIQHSDSTTTRVLCMYRNPTKIEKYVLDIEWHRWYLPYRTLSILFHFGVATLNSWAKLKKLARDSIWKKKHPWSLEPWTSETCRGRTTMIKRYQKHIHQKPFITKMRNPRVESIESTLLSLTDPPLLRKKWSL